MALKRVLVVSDSHGAYHLLERIVLRYPDAKTIVFLGDGRSDIEMLVDKYPKKQYIIVRGNCDFASLAPETFTIFIGNQKIYCTHGYIEQVKFGLSGLICRAKRVEANIALYGHTHIQKNEKMERIRCINPGSVQSGEYAILDIMDTSMAVNLCSL